MARICPTCKQEQALAGGYCRACRREYKREWQKKNRKIANGYSRKYRAKNKTAVQEYNIKCRYGLSKEGIDGLLAKQQFKCAACLVGLTKTNIQIDHCHSTGKVRGILCRHCNTALGFMKDDIDAILRLADYARRHKL